MAGELSYDGRHVAILSEREEQLLSLLIEHYPLPVHARHIARLLLGSGPHHPGYSKGLARRVRLKAGCNVVLSTTRGYRLEPDAVPEGGEWRPITRL